MEEISPESVAAVLRSVSSYGGQLAAVFHNYSLIAERIPSGFEGAINILDATVTTLKQVLILLEAQPSKKLFSADGLQYVNLLAVECSSTLAKVEPAIDEGCLDRKDRKALQKSKKKAASKKVSVIVDPLSLSLDAKELLEKTEKTKWSWALGDIEKCMERLYELQLHLLLVFQVVTVCMISRDVSSGHIDIEKLVNYHDRIKRTANLVGIKPPATRSVTVRDKFGRRMSFSSLESSSSSDSDSDSDSDASPKERVRPECRYPPPPPPPGTRSGPRPVIDLTDSSNLSTAKETSTTEDTDVVLSVESTNPPSYAESRKPESSSTMLGTVTTASSEVSDQKDQKVEKDENDENDENDEKEKLTEPKVSEPAVVEGRLFKSKSTGFGFNLKNLFRSKDTLAEEMRRTLSDTETRLTAFIVQRHSTRAVPHSAFHSLEATHMKTILSQLNNNSWYKTFSTLDMFEHGAIDLLVHPWFDGKVHERELIVLKVLQQNKMNAWMALLTQLLRSQPFPQTGRVLLAIFREKLVDGKPVPFGSRPPPPRLMPPVPNVRNTRRPPLPHNFGLTNKISDLKIPPPPSPPPGWCPPPGPSPPLLPSVDSSKRCSVRINDTTLFTEQDAFEALINYSEYTVRPCDPPTPSSPRTWSLVAVTQESAEQHLIKKRVELFESREGNVIETKLRLTQDQSAQVTRLMDDIKFKERDYRFEWCWVEISLHNTAGEITDFIANGPMNHVRTATTMHLIAKRMLKPQYIALDVYNALMKRGSAGPPGFPRPLPPAPSTTIHVEPSPVPRRRRACRDDSSDSDSDSTSWSSDSSVGAVRRRLRRYKAKKTVSRYRSLHSDNSDSGSETEEEKDAIEIKLKLKKGDDVVKKLLEIWTAGSEGKGKGKMI